MTALFVLAWILAVALALVGIAGLLAPQLLSRGYGVHAQDRSATGYVRATGIRDVAIGVAIGTAAYLHDVAFVAVLMAVGIVVSIADFAIAVRHGEHRRIHPAHGVHAAGIVAFALALAMALFAIGK